MYHIDRVFHILQAVSEEWKSILITGIYIGGQDPSVSKTNRLHVDIFRFFFIRWRNIL